MKKRGIVLFNLGGPERLADVKPFLYRLFSDPDILVGIPTPLRQTLAFLISRIKGGGSIKAYASIGGGSPQLKWTRLQAEGLARLLAASTDGAEHEFKVVIGMQAWNPTILDALRELKAWGADDVILFPLFPHFSTTTTGGCLKQARAALAKLGWRPPLREIVSWADHAGYIQILRRTIDERLVEHPGAHVLLSAHSLPMKIIERGDRYPSEVERTVRALTDGLAAPWSLAFQSRNGPVPWLQPYTEDELARLGRSGRKEVIVAPISFVSDHIETLHELDELYMHQARGHGIETYVRTRAFNDDPEFFEVLRSVYVDHRPG
jgi:ferrochelatase